MKKVAIIGYANNWKEAPFDDPETEIWVQNISEILKYGFPRFTRIFDIHTTECILKEAKAFPDGLELLKKGNYPVYTQEQIDMIPGSIEFPLDELTAEFFPWSTKLGKWRYEDAYWTSSTQMMLALAIHGKCEEIGIYGIDMADTVEYRAQRRGCEYMLGIAVGKGIKIRRTRSTPVLRTKFIYGYETVEEQSYRANIMSTIDYLNQRVNQLNETGMKAASEKSHLMGALHAYDELMKNWLDA